MPPRQSPRSHPRPSDCWSRWASHRRGASGNSEGEHHPNEMVVGPEPVRGAVARGGEHARCPTRYSPHAISSVECSPPSQCPGRGRYGVGALTGECTLTGVAWQTKSARLVPCAVTTTLIVAAQLSGAGPPGSPDSPPITVYEPGGSVTEYRPSAPTRATWPCPLPFGARKPSTPPRRCTVPLPGRKFSPPR